MELSKGQVWRETTRELVSQMARERKLTSTEILLLERFVNFGEKILSGQDKKVKVA